VADSAFSRATPFVAAADLRLPMVAISLLYRRGFFTQRLAEDGSQTEEPVEWRVGRLLEGRKPPAPASR